MKKLALLAGLAGILATAAMADSTSGTATVTVSVAPYIAIHMTGPVTPGVTSNDAVNQYITGNSYAYSVDSNEAWTAAAAFSTFGPGTYANDFNWFAVTTTPGGTFGSGIGSSVGFNVTVPHTAGRGGDSAKATLTITVTQ